MAKNQIYRLRSYAVDDVPEKDAYGRETLVTRQRCYEVLFFNRKSDAKDNLQLNPSTNKISRVLDSISEDELMKFNPNALIL